MKGTTMASIPTANVDVVINGPMLRLEALDRAVRVSLSGGRHESDAEVITRAEAFHTFLANDA